MKNKKYLFSKYNCINSKNKILEFISRNINALWNSNGNSDNEGLFSRNTALCRLTGSYRNSRFFKKAIVK
jgi:hypothetical protein